jgi:hypothetical protein
MQICITIASEFWPSLNRRRAGLPNGGGMRLYVATRLSPPESCRPVLCTTEYPRNSTSTRSPQQRQPPVAMPGHLIRGQDEERPPHIVGLTTARLDPRVVRFDQADRGVVIQETVTNAPLDPSKRPNVTLQRYLGGILKPS